MGLFRGFLFVLARLEGFNKGDASKSWFRWERVPDLILDIRALERVIRRKPLQFLLQQMVSSRANSQGDMGLGHYLFQRVIAAICCWPRFPGLRSPPGF